MAEILIKPITVRDEFECICPARCIQYGQDWYLTDIIEGDDIGFLVVDNEEPCAEFYFLINDDIYSVVFDDFERWAAPRITINGSCMKLSKPRRSLSTSKAGLIRRAVRKYARRIMK